LTAKQLAFAHLVAQGNSKTEALVRAYPGGRRNRQTARVEGYRLSKKPHVAAEIARLVAERFPEDIDYRRLLQKMLQNMLQLSYAGTDSVRLQATVWLFRYACAHESMAGKVGHKPHGG
jgi:phage terminase small subunit